MILFFSSDKNALFQKDVLSALSLPNGHCVHFRYWEEIVSKSILDKFNSDRLRNLEGILIYVKNNNSRIEKKERKVESFPVRKVQIVDYRKDLKTGLIHFNLELGDFVNPKINYPEPDDLPPFKMLSEGSVSIINSIAWHEKVENLVSFDSTLTEALFYNFKLISL